MKSIKFIFAAVIIMTFIIFGCQKESFEPQIDVPQQEQIQDQEKDSISDETDVFISQDSLDYAESLFKSYNSSWIMNSRLSDIPSYVFNINYKYKTAYQHFQQPDWTSCSWTSYMLVASCMIKAKKGYSFPLTAEKVYTIKDQCKAIAGSTNNAKRITTLESHARQYYPNYFNVDRPSIGTDRTYAIKYMLNHLYTYNTPMIAITTYETEEGKRNGHYIIIQKIYWKKGGIGSKVYYTNCGRRCQNGDSWGTNLYEKDLYVFLDEMYNNPATRGYNILAFQPTNY